MSLSIVGGRWRGRRLAAPAGARPTSAKARAALFSMLQARGLPEGALVLDAYAGSGALGLEALSRGAAAAFFLERNAHALAGNIRALGCGGQVLGVAREARRPPPAALRPPACPPVRPPARQRPRRGRRRCLPRTAPS